MHLVDFMINVGEYTIHGFYGKDSFRFSCIARNLLIGKIQWGNTTTRWEISRLGKVTSSTAENTKTESFTLKNWWLEHDSWLQGGPLNGVITPKSRVFSPQWPIYFRPFIRLIIRLITAFVTGRGPPCRWWWWWCLINIFLKNFTPNVLGFHDFHFDVYAPYFFKRGLKPQPAATWKISCDVNFQPTWNP